MLSLESTSERWKGEREKGEKGESQGIPSVKHNPVLVENTGSRKHSQFTYRNPRERDRVRDTEGERERQREREAASITHRSSPDLQ